MFYDINFYIFQFQAPYNQGISGGYDSDAEGGAYDSRIGGSFGEKAVSHHLQGV